MEIKDKKITKTVALEKKNSYLGLNISKRLLVAPQELVFDKFEFCITKHLPRKNVFLLCRRGQRNANDLSNSVIRHSHILRDTA